jgi:ABC-type cobalt transport system substrate-binding protein
VVYTAEQKKGLLPENWDAQKRNIVVFNSSEDEFTSLGRDWDKLSLFESQLEGVAFICKAVSQDKNCHVYVRIHPNLKGNPYRYHMGLYELQKQHNNLTVIGPESPVSTYSLMDATNLGISFGSSAGIEASASKKPVILLAGCYYYHLNATYNPQSKAELESLLLDAQLMSKPELGAQIFGYYMSYPEAYTWPFKYEVKRIKRFGLSLWDTPHLAFWGSKRAYKTLFFGYQKWRQYQEKALKSQVPQIEN